MTQFMFGADPEIFVKSRGVAVSAHGLVEGTKDKPLKTSNGAVQVDGMALEINITPTPMADFNSFNFNIVKTVKDLKEMIGDKYNFNYEPVQEFDPEYMAKQPDEAKELGCDPDYSAYTLKANPRPDGTRDFRTGAGHVHIGWGADIPTDNEEHMEICAGFVKVLDCTVGIFMAFIDREPRRRELYGKAGAFRPKPYGVEYRTPSNVWLKNKDRRKLMHYMMNRAVVLMQMGYTAERITGVTQDEVIRIINEGDYKTAETIVTELLVDNYNYQVGSSWNTVRKEMQALQAKATKVELPSATA